MSKSPDQNPKPNLTAEEAEQILSRFQGKRVLVLGDVMLDEYLVGDVHRISPEAPVPIVDIQSRTDVPGGAANVASNIAGLGGSAVLVGMVGNDESADHLRSVLAANGVSSEWLVTAGERPTVTKTRIVSGQQQIVRLDRELTANISAAHAHAVLSLFERNIADVDACLLSDYAKGLLTPEICAHVISRARQLRKPVVVDPKGASFLKYSGCSIITPNIRETEVASKHIIESEGDLFKAVSQLQNSLGDAAVLVTRGPDGMTLFRDSVEVLHAPALAREVFDVTGAGDTVVGTLTLAIAAGLPLEEAILLANIAASVVVQKTGTATVSREEILASTNQSSVQDEGQSRRQRPFGSIATPPAIPQ
jgi:D-beta-D-heptose 7-phosphate kinase/D-beta-D-heptose 1-phosphate adenosyltransferase